MMDEIREGIRLVRHDPILRAFAGAQMAISHAVGHLRDDLVAVHASTSSASAPAAIGVDRGRSAGSSSLVGALVASPRDAALGDRAGRRSRRSCSSTIGNLFIPLAPAGPPLDRRRAA